MAGIRQNDKIYFGDEDRAEIHALFPHGVRPKSVGESSGRCCTLAATQKNKKVSLLIR
jgi:hypothetical protein